MISSSFSIDFSYNLLPLIKGLIDHSDFLFASPNNVTEQFQESYEQTNESVAKSSGFSSFSSLLSTSERPLRTKSRSASMPSICIAASSSIDSGSQSLDEDAVRPRRPLSFTEDDQTMTTEATKSASSDFLQLRSTNDEKKKSSSSSADNILLASNDEPRDSLTDVPVVIRKMEKYSSKKTFADRLSKPFNSLKLTMPKAFQSHSTSNVTEPTNVPMRKSVQEKKSSTQSQSAHLKEVLSQKEAIIVQLTRTCQEERQRFEKEIQQLRAHVEQLQNENLQLKRQLNLQ